MPQELSQTITCVSYFVIKPQYREQCITALLKLVPLTRAEPGCLQYELIQDNKDLNFLIMVEKFVDQKAFDEHEKQPHIQKFVSDEMKVYCEKVTWNEGREYLP